MLNGLHIKDIVFTVPINTGTPTYVTLGDRLDLAGQNFTGYIHSAQFYNRALSPAEAYGLYHIPYAIFEPHHYVTSLLVSPIKHIFYYLYNQDI